MSLCTIRIWGRLVFSLYLDEYFFVVKNFDKSLDFYFGTAFDWCILLLLSGWCLLLHILIIVFIFVL